VNETNRLQALTRLFSGGQSFTDSSAADLKRAVVIDGIAVLLLLLAIAGATLG